MIFTDKGLFGFDVSFYQDNNETPTRIDFVKMRNYGVSFVNIKAGQLTYSDEDWKYNWEESRKAGLNRGSYWFCDKYDTGVAQARKYWELLKGDVGEGIHFADYEGGSWTDWNQLYNFLSEFQQKSGLPDERIGIYTGYYYWVKYSPLLTSKLNWFSKYPLWLAWYTSNINDVQIPKPWKECLMWQSGTPAIGFQVGVESREIDYNLFNGDLEKLKKYYGSVVIAEPPTGEIMVLYQADLKTGITSNVRLGPGTGYSIVKQLTGPLTVDIIGEKSVANGYTWYQINSPVEGYIALTSSYSALRPVNTVPSTKPVITVTLEAEGYPTKVITWEPLP